MSITLTLSADELPDTELQELTRGFCDKLIRDTELDAELKKETSTRGEKGEPITIGVIIISFISSGAAAALIQAISAYFARTKILVFTLTKANGVTYSITSENVSAEETEKTLQKLKAFLED